jgi:hypothetical protein
MFCTGAKLIELVDNFKTTGVIFIDNRLVHPCIKDEGWRWIRGRLGIVPAKSKPFESSTSVVHIGWRLCRNLDRA